MQQAVVKTEIQGPSPASPPKVTPEVIEDTKQQLKLLQNMVTTMLTRGIDYGRIPNTPADSLWDPGASLIISSFNSYPGERRVINFRDDGEMIAICIEVPIVSRKTGEVIGSGVGAASTKESKYKYRWVENPAEWGYEGDAIKTLKTKSEGDKTLYKIRNPEHGELLNTIVKMASKRAEVDAAESLPGVATALRRLFQGKQQALEKPDWTRFWGEVIRLGLSEDEVHQNLGVSSLKSWLERGKTLEQALDALRQTFSQSESKPSKTTKDPSTITTPQQLLNACYEEFSMQPDDVAHEIGYGSQQELMRQLTGKTDKLADAYLQIRALRLGPSATKA